MPRGLHRRLQRMLPHYGDCSKLVTYLIEHWIAGEISTPGLTLKSITNSSVALSNTSLGAQLDARHNTTTADPTGAGTGINIANVNWQQP
jgi:hypothetical protein